MSSIIPVIICILAMVIQMCLQLVPGGFALFYHYALGKNNAKKADDFALYFILGVEAMVSVLWLIVYTITYAIACLQPDFGTGIFAWVMAGILLGEAVVMFFCYYRSGRRTALFIPRSVAGGITEHAKKTHTRMGALMLGAVVCLPELLFTLPLYIVSAVALMQFVTVPPFLVIIGYVLSAMVPLFLVRGMYRAGQNLADIERLRVRMKPFVRILLAAAYLIMAVAVINMGVVNG